MANKSRTRNVGVTPETVSGVPLKVLVVDDTEGNRYAVSHLLRGAGLDVIEAETGVEALRRLKDEPDLIILDINLPDISGHDVLKRVRNDPELSWIPVMHVTASYTGSESHARGLDLGADAYLTHPFDPQVFMATTRALLRLSQAEAKVRRASQEWRAAFDSLADGIFVIGHLDGRGDADRVLRCNRPAAALLGDPPRKVVGLLWSDVLDRFDVQDEESLQPVKPGNPAPASSDVEISDKWYHVSMLHSSRVGDADGFCVCVLRDITDHKKAEQDREDLMHQAKQAQGEAESANRAKGEFLAVMSHELRTPLNAIGGYVDLLTLGLRGPLTAEQHADLARIKRSQTSLTTLINDLLNFAKTESGELEYHISVFPVSEAMSRASEVVENQLVHRGLSYIAEPVPADLNVVADPNKVQQIILNLLSNAIKFTPSGGTITLSAADLGETVAINVTDTGEGIQPDMLDAIFEPFVQVHPGRIREQSGVGLGLAISRDLARGMGGDLSVAESSNRGTSFVLTLKKG